MLNKNGVTPRIVNNGDPWSDCHRSQVDPEFAMTDLDGLFGAMFFERDTGDQLFLEYMANYNRVRYGVTAIFERKARIPEKHSAGRARYETQRGFLCWVARAIGAYQKITPKVMYVVNLQGGHSFWQMNEIDPETCAITGRRWLLRRGASWMDVWDSAGMVDIKTALRDLVP